MMTSDKVEDTKETSTDLDITDIIGKVGRWQTTQLLVFLFTGFFPAWHIFSITFLAPDIDHWCAPPPELSNNSDKWKNWSIPVETREGESRFSQCEKYDFTNRTYEDNFVNSSNIVQCTEWQYDRSFYKATIVDEWDLVCEKKWLVSVASFVYMVGSLLSSTIVGHLADRYGRRPVILLCVFVMTIVGTTTAFSTSFIMFAILRFLISFGGGGIYIVGFVTLSEVVSMEYRTVFGMSPYIGSSIAYVILPGIAWLLRDWFYIQLAISVPCVISFILIWSCIYESPRWLLTQKRLDETEKILSIATSTNKKDVGNMEEIVKKLYSNISKDYKDEVSKQGTILDLLRTPTLRKKTLTLCFIWFVTFFTYYGLSLNTNELGGDPYINFLISGMVEFPSYLLSGIILKYSGRRLPLCGAMLVSGAVCIISILIQRDILWLKVGLAMTGKLGVCCALTFVNVYSAEVFPTVVRSIGLGTSATIGLIGSAVSPFTKEIGRATYATVPLGIYGGLCIISSLLVFMLPETKNQRLPETLEQAEQMDKESKLSKENQKKTIKRDFSSKL